MNHETDAPQFNPDVNADLEIDLRVPAGIDVIKLVDTVRACSSIMNEFAHNNHEIKIRAEKKISTLQSDLFSERKKVLEFQEELQKLTQKLDTISINAFQQGNGLKTEIKELTLVNSSLSLRNQFLEEELRKAHKLIELIYSTTANELTNTLEELQKIHKINLFFDDNKAKF